MSTPRSTPDGRGEKPRVGGLFVPTRKLPSELYRTLSLVEYVVGAQERACMRAPRPRRFLSDALVRPGDARESRACPFDSLPEKTPCLFVTPLSPLASGGWK